VAEKTTETSPLNIDRTAIWTRSPRSAKGTASERIILFRRGVAEVAAAAMTARRIFLPI